MIRIAIFELNKNRRDALKFLINLQPGMHCIADGEDYAGIFANADSIQPDLVIMDVNALKAGAIQDVRFFRQFFPDTLVVMQKDFEDDEIIFDCILAGAHGYILKTASNAKLIESIREAARDKFLIMPGLAGMMLNYFSKTKMNGRRNVYNLTGSELDILMEMASGISYQMISEKHVIPVGRVSAHIRDIISKLHIHGGAVLNRDGNK
ncbi:response regulator transcription factor [Dyadobacter sp. NIV53]|uniref:response regulator transcription factor n=1 Tax=Dyadobacter sp. NIV53 TaxID=2861765 RepID=UPI001C889E7D|nr:response regulator transcription factor [Dyadobacter sp. NIV53]